MKKLILISIIGLVLSGCAGTGFEKRMTFVPDQVKLEVDSNPQDNWNSKEVTVGGSWNLK
jgi:hypothetical protein